MGSTARQSSGFRRGFSLIELLIVVMIITAVLSLVLASVSTAREAAKRTICASNLRQLGQAMQMYANEYRGWVLRNSGTPELLPASHRPWVIMLKPREWAHLPELALAEAASRERVLKCPSHPYPQIATHFVVNVIAVADFPLPEARFYRAGATKLSAIRRASSVVFLTERADSGFSWRDPPEDEWESCRIVNLWQADVAHEGDLPGVPTPWFLGASGSVASDRHGPDVINACYFDGSVRTVGARELRQTDFDDGIPLDRRHDPYFAPFPD